uniref:Cell adhesion protein byn-1 (inferred by orthology to a C. elegans protein) n=1 Tax=Strongyloides venezuelensis TaxID=75913 RepID=A0A0K0G107_STRVS
MGRKNKLKGAVGDTIIGREAPLDEQIKTSVQAKARSNLRVKSRDFKRTKDEEFVNGKLSAKVLKQAKKQLLEEDDIEIGNNNKSAVPPPVFSKPTKQKFGSDDEESDDDVGGYEYEEEVIDIDPEEEEAMAKFYINDNVEEKRTLYDIIMQRIEMNKESIQKEVRFQDFDDVTVKELDVKVIEMFTKVGEVMANYRSGKIPKAFKIIPSMVNWEQILALTNPENWSDIAYLAATRLFTANLNDKMCQRYNYLILLPRLRDSISKEKKLNFHLYQALRKSIFKTAAFFKGIIIPLCESGTCSLREATIFGSVLHKAHIPVMHASAAMLKIAEMNYSGANSYFIKAFIEKKMTLPFRVIDGLVFHFLKMETDTRDLPVLWHQSLLTFIKHYRADISSEQRDALRNLIKVKSHPKITPEIRNLLTSAESRNVESEQNIPDYVYDDSMEF